MTAPTPNAPTATLSADEAIAKRIAARAVQSLADSLPDEDTIEAQDRLKGTPQESLFVVSAETLEELIAVAISNAMYDGELGATAALLAARRREEANDALLCEIARTAITAVDSPNFNGPHYRTALRQIVAFAAATQPPETIPQVPASIAPYRPDVLAANKLTGVNDA